MYVQVQNNYENKKKLDLTSWEIQHQDLYLENLDLMILKFTTKFYI